VVKELLENSLDAGATELTLEIEKGGKQLIKITDNGEGISKEDLPLTIERYTTSKITTEKDLNTITSYGFRGEALATISEVSGFRIQSKPRVTANEVKQSPDNEIATSQSSSQ
jgi:DNA mismatch repair protein MutL